MRKINQQYEQQNYTTSMSRQQLLFKLLQKVEKSNQYMYSHFCNLSQSPSQPSTIKRMQILPMGSCRINPPISKLRQDPIFQKQNSANNKRVFVLQRVKSMSKDQDKNKTNQQQGEVIESHINYHSLSIQTWEKRSIQNFKTQAESPLRNNKKFVSMSSPLRNSGPQREMGTVKSQKYCQYNSNEINKQSARSQSIQQKGFKRRLSNSSRINNIQEISLSNKQQERRIKVQLRKQVNKNYQKAFTPPPKITAKSYIVYQMINIKDQVEPILKVHTAFNSKIRVQIASLTKIMTCIVAMEICQKLNLKSTQQQIKIGKFQSSIGGTTANLEINDVYNLHDLLHGLMLPSGNDASLAIAVWGGKKLIQQKQLNDGQLIFRKKMKKQCYNRFIQQMNAKAQQLGMTKTNYSNSHGLINLLNRSCAHDIGILSHYCMKNSYFASIVSCKQYKCNIRIQTKILVENKQKNQKTLKVPNIQNQQDQQLSDVDSEVSEGQQIQKQQENIQMEQKIITTYRDVFWENTHKLLHKFPKQYLGIKTGITTAAGPCLSSCVLTPCGRKLFIVVLNCKKIQMRFKQTQILKKWVYKKQGIIKKSSLSNGSKSTKSLANNSQQDNQSLEQPQNPIGAFD